MGKSDYKVHELVGKIERGELQLPEMQRKYVWTSTKVRDLLDSLYRGYPSGVILTWQPGDDVQTQSFAVDTQESSIGNPLLLLDGQQRLTSLSAVLRGEPVHVKGRKRPVEILFNLEHPDALTFITEVVEEQEDEDESPDEAEMDPLARANKRAFIVSSNSLLGQSNWVRVSDVFLKPDSEILRRAGIENFDDPRYEKYSSRLKRLRDIRDYEYRVDILEPTKSYEEVTEIFVRVNSLGAKLRSSDLALAQITAKWNGSLHLFEKYQREVKERGFDLDMSIHLKTLVAIVTGQSRFTTVAGLSRAQLEDGWENAKRAMDFATNYAENNLGVNSPALLSSPFMLVTLAYWGHEHHYKIDSTDEATFRRWFLTANAKGRYSRGSSETLLDQDLQSVRSSASSEALLQRLEQQVGRLTITAEDLRGRTSRSGAFKTLFIMFRAAHARDWDSRLRISPKHSGGPDKIEFHHIFPKAHLQVARPNLEPRDVDDLANLAFIGAATNKKIRDKAPSVYRNNFDRELLREQLVDFDSAPDTADQFEAFMDWRRARLAEGLNTFLNPTPQDHEDA